MKNMKIKINSPEHSKQVQEALFALGCMWAGYDELTDVKHTARDQLYVNYCGNQTFRIAYGAGDVFFDSQNQPQHWLHSDGQFYDYKEDKKVNNVDAEEPTIKGVPVSQCVGRKVRVLAPDYSARFKYGSKHVVNDYSDDDGNHVLTDEGAGWWDDADDWEWVEEDAPVMISETGLSSITSLEDLFKYVRESENEVRLYNTRVGVYYYLGGNGDGTYHTGGHKELSNIITKHFTGSEQRAKIQQQIDEKKAAIAELELQMEELG